jgi:hypothetical protein
MKTAADFILANWAFLAVIGVEGLIILSLYFSNNTLKDMVARFKKTIAEKQNTDVQRTAEVFAFCRAIETILNDTAYPYFKSQIIGVIEVGAAVPRRQAETFLRMLLPLAGNALVQEELRQNVKRFVARWERDHGVRFYWTCSPDNNIWTLNLTWTGLLQPVTVTANLPTD